MNIALTTQSMYSDYDGNCECAVLDLTPELLQEIYRRVEAAEQWLRQETELSEVHFYCPPLDFYDDKLLYACEEVAGKTGVLWLDRFRENGCAALPEGVDLAAYVPKSTEYNEQVLRYAYVPEGRQFQVAWLATPKYTDIRVITHALSLETMETLLSEEDE